MLCRKCKTELQDDAIFCHACGKKLVKQTATLRKHAKRANGRGSVYKLSGNRAKPWTARVGNVYLGYYATKTDATTALEIALAGGNVNEHYNMTLEDVYNSWADTYFTPTTNRKTREEKEGAWRRLQALGKHKMRELKTSDYQAVINAAVTAERKNKSGDVVAPSRPLSRAAKMQIKKLASQLCIHAMKDDIINKNYARLVVMPENDKIEKDIFTKAQIEKLWDNAMDRSVQIILIMIYTGLRVDELMSMERNKVNIAGEYMVGGEKTEAGKNRYIPLSKKIMPFVKRFDEEGNKFLISNSETEKMLPDVFRIRYFYPTLERIGIIEKPRAGERRTLTPHSTRYTFFNLIRNSGADKDLIKLVMGHEEYSDSVEMYGKATDEDKANLKKVVDLF